MSEVQNHGFQLENWVKKTFFNDCIVKYSEKWDIPASYNNEYGKLPISIKSVKYKSSIGLGDAIRQFKIDEDFILIVFFWIQNGSNKKIECVSSNIIKVDNWKKMWQPIDKDNLEILDSIIKTEPSYIKAREKAKNILKNNPFNNSIISLNPKIDSKTQRRLQCSLSYKNYLENIDDINKISISEKLKLWDVNVPIYWNSNPRKFNKFK